MIRLDTPYVDPDRTLTQAGYEVLKGQERRIDAAEADIDALEAVAITAAPGAAPKYACRAWVNFNGTGTVAIRAAGNVSSITDNGTGDYTVNFTTPMPDADYGASINSLNDTPSGLTAANACAQATLAGSIRVRTYDTQGIAFRDATAVSVAVFR